MPLRISVILAHPREESFNHAIARVVVEQLERNGHEVLFHDLYRNALIPCCPEKKFPETPCCPMPLRSTARKLPKRTVSSWYIRIGGDNPPQS